MQGMKGILVLTSIFLVGCGQFKSDDSNKKDFIRENGVFSSEALAAAIADGSDSPYPIVEVQRDWDEMGRGPIVFGEPLYSSPEEILQENQGDQGLVMPLPNEGDNGVIMPPSDDDVGISPLIDYQSSVNPKARACVMPASEKPGVEYQIGATGNYTGCVPCAVFDYNSNRCIKINITRKPTKRQLPMPGQNRRRGFNVGTLLMGLAAISLISNLATPTTQYTTGGPTSTNTNHGGLDYSATLPENGYDINDPNCPLVVDVGEMDGYSSSNLELSAPDEGILFDIRGRKYENKKLPISWTNNPRYKFLVKPTGNGQVLGIDEMFGNHTFGPDGKFSSNGFEALAKHDGVDFRGRILGPQEGRITSEDPIFHQLRLWTDSNFDGAAQPDELATLEDYHIESIDLDYDENFYERDVHGNEAIFKSVVNFENGKMGMVFDLWFADGLRF